jgi:hypothetical protein
LLIDRTSSIYLSVKDTVSFVYYFFFYRIIKKTSRVLQPYAQIYIEDVLSINNNNFHIYVHLIYPDELEVKDTT